MLQIKKKTANIWEYKVGNNANIANLVCLWKTRMIEINQSGLRRLFPDSEKKHISVFITWTVT